MPRIGVRWPLGANVGIGSCVPPHPLYSTLEAPKLPQPTPLTHRFKSGIPAQAHSSSTWHAAEFGDVAIP